MAASLPASTAGRFCPCTITTATTAAVATVAATAIGSASRLAFGGATGCIQVLQGHTDRGHEGAQLPLPRTKLHLLPSQITHKVLKCSPNGHHAHRVTIAVLYILWQGECGFGEGMGVPAGRRSHQGPRSGIRPPFTHSLTTSLQRSSSSAPPIHTLSHHFSTEE
jgi:hypothetical protein